MQSPPPSRPLPPWYNPPEAMAPGGAGWRIREQAPPPEPVIGADADSRGADSGRLTVVGRHAGRAAYAVLAAVTALAAAAALAVVINRGYEAPHTISQPAAINGFTLAGPQANSAPGAGSVVQALTSLGATQVLSGVYGPAGAPRLELVIAKAQAPVETGLQLLGDVARDAASGGWTVSTGDATQTSRDGVDFACAPAAQQGTAVTLCVWGDVDVIGTVIDTAAPGAALSDTIAGRAAAEH